MSLMSLDRHVYLSHSTTPNGLFLDLKLRDINNLSELYITIFTKDCNLYMCSPESDVFIVHPMEMDKFVTIIPIEYVKNNRILLKVEDSIYEGLSDRFVKYG